MTPTVLMVPGLRDYVAEHWQTLLVQKLPKVVSVPPLEHGKLSCAARVAALDAALAKVDGPVILVAHSAGVMITVHWAQQHSRKIHGALLAAPADLGRRCPQAIRPSMHSPGTVGSRFHESRCRSRALSVLAATIRSRSSSVRPRWRKTGAVGSSTWAMSVT